MRDQRNIMCLPATLAGSVVMAVAADALVGITAATAQEPLRIAKRGSLEAGGETASSRTVKGRPRLAMPLHARGSA